MRPWGGVRTHQPEVRRSCGPGPGRGAVGCSAKAAAPEAGAGRGPRGGHSLARTAGPAPRGRGRRPGLLSLTAREGEPGLGGVGGPETPNEPKTPGPAFKALQPRSEHPQPVSAAAGSRCPTGTAAPARPRAPPRVWASRWRLAWRAGPVTSSLLSPPFSSPVSSRVAVSSAGLPDSLLFARRRPRSTAAQSAPFVYRVVFLTFESASML